MIQVSAIVPAGAWDPKREIDHVLIDYDRRFREGLPRLGRTLEEEYKILREQEQRLIAGTKYLPA